ncbi:MAG: AAA family ATPase, partial [Clostridium sp.]|nr:AAA family ATPase [Clostridium sp.]
CSEESKYTLHVMDSNPYGLREETQQIEPTVLDAMLRVVKSPPIILQLCGVYDQEKHTRLAAVAFDSLLNIVLGIVYLNKGKNNETLKVVQEYYQQISVFMNSNEKKLVLNQRYWFKKISSDRLDTEFYEEFEFEDNIQTMKIRQQERIDNLKQEHFLSQQEKKNEEEKNSVQEHYQLAQRSESAKRLDQYLEDLNSLIGLKEVKQEANSLINLIKVKRMREKYQMTVTEMTYHMVFTGNPGTGKTTVARLMAKIYKELGILSKGHLVETDRSGLVAGYVGQTALKVKEVVERAIGGILFIDEAYSLTNQSMGNDYGQEVIDTLVKLMEDNRNDLVVIVAGYQDEMKKFLDSNPGLISRFNKFICFSDYTCQELIDILDYMSEKDGIAFTSDARNDILNQMMNMEEKQRKAFGNARGVRNAFEKILLNQANRLVKLENPTKEQLQEVLVEDVYHVIL